MHWSIQATILILCIVTCAAQGRGSRRFSASSTSPTSIQEEEDVANNHRFQARHGKRTDTKESELPSGRELPSRQQQSGQESTSEVASTRRSIASRGDNEIIRSTSRSLSRQRAEPSTTRQYLSRNSRPSDAGIRRRIDVDISTEEVVTRGSVRSRNEKIRPSYNSRGTAVEQESTTVQYRGRNFPSRDKVTQQERTSSQTRTRNGGNIRQNEANQSRAGRGRSLALEEPITQSLRPRGRGFEKTTITDDKTTSNRLSETRSGNSRFNEPTRITSNRSNDQKISDNTVTRSRGRNAVRGRASIRTEPPVPVSNTTSTKIIEEVSVSSSEVPVDTSSQGEVMSIDVTQALEVPSVPQLQEVSSEEVPVEASTKKQNGNGITAESTLPLTEERERLKVVTTAKVTTERSTRTSVRSRGRVTNGRLNESRNGYTRNGENSASNPDADNETVTRSSRRNSQRFTTSRPAASTRTTVVERPTSALHHGGRGRSRDFTARLESPRNSRPESDVTTSNYRARNNLYQNNAHISSTPKGVQLDDHTYTYVNSPSSLLAVDNTKKVNDDLPAVVVESEVNKAAIASDSELQANNNSPTASGTSTKQVVTSDRQVNNALRGKLGRGSARASKTEVITCTCFSKSACNFVHCPQV